MHYRCNQDGIANVSVLKVQVQCNRNNILHIYGFTWPLPMFYFFDMITPLFLIHLVLRQLKSLLWLLNTFSILILLFKLLEFGYCNGTVSDLSTPWGPKSLLPIYRACPYNAVVQKACNCTTIREL